MSGYLSDNYSEIYNITIEKDISTGKSVHYDDFESIDNKYGAKIKYGHDNLMSCYIPSLEKGMSVLEEIFDEKVGGIFPKGDATIKKRFEKHFLKELDIMDFEIYFTFYEKDLEYICKKLGISKIRKRKE